VPTIHLFDLPNERDEHGKNVTPFVIIHGAEDYDANRRAAEHLRAFREEIGARSLAVTPSAKAFDDMADDDQAKIDTDDDVDLLHIKVTPEFDEGARPAAKTITAARRALAEKLAKDEDEEDDD
jgi:hypothetical protein